MKSIIGVCQFSFQNSRFSIEVLPLFCSALLSIILTKTCQGKVTKESRIQINNATNVLKK